MISLLSTAGRKNIYNSVLNGWTFSFDGVSCFFLFVRMKFRPLHNLIRFGLSTKYINMGLFIKIMVGSSRLLDYVNRSTFEQISSPWRKRESCTVLFSSSSLTFRLKLLVWEPKYSRSSPTSAPFLPRFLFSWLSDWKFQYKKHYVQPTLQLHAWLDSCQCCSAAR